MAGSDTGSDVHMDSPLRRVLSDPDLLHCVILHFTSLESIRCFFTTSKAFRAAALHQSLTSWTVLNQLNFATLETREAERSTFNLHNIKAALAAKPQVTLLDLAHCHVGGAGALEDMLSVLPSALESLSVTSDCNQPDLMLTTLRSTPRVRELPRLMTMDLRGVLTLRTLAGLRMLRMRRDLDDKGSQPPPRPLEQTIALPLPHLERLAVGFHLFHLVGAREGTAYLNAQLAVAPKLCSVGCGIAADFLRAIDVRCGVCRRVLYAKLRAYVVHPPQQRHITYELHTDQQPIRTAVKELDGDPTRLQCIHGCHDDAGLWLVDGGSGHVAHLLGKPFAIACGPPKNGRPPLAIATWAGLTADDECVGFTCVNREDETFSPFNS
jgi:hypothetical protein